MMTKMRIDSSQPPGDGRFALCPEVNRGLLAAMYAAWL
jgi:hypothetical protein